MNPLEILTEMLEKEMKRHPFDRDDQIRCWWSQEALREAISRIKIIM